jgi:DNA-binding NtrC family response regulator
MSMNNNPEKESGCGQDSKTSTCTILVVDDEHVIADTLVAIFKTSGYSARAAYSGEAALAAMDRSVPDLLITDVCMPGINGVQLAIQVRRRYPQCKILLFSGHASSAGLLQEARAQGYEFEFLTKPIHPRDLIARLRPPEIESAPLRIAS